jgi:hypothetical protein
MPNDAPIAHKLGSRFDDIESRLDQLEQTPTGRPLTDRLALRSHEVAEVLGLSRSSWHSYVGRGLCPPSIASPTGHTRLYRRETLADWLRHSERAGRLLTRDEYLSAVAAEAAESHERRPA